jgi:hypothetical protein
VGYELSPEYHALIEQQLGLFYQGPTTESFVSMADVSKPPPIVLPEPVVEPVIVRQLTLF